MRNFVQLIEVIMATVVWLSAYSSMCELSPLHSTRHLRRMLIHLAILSTVTFLCRHTAPSALLYVCVFAHGILLTLQIKKLEIATFFKSLIAFVISRLITLLSLIAVNGFIHRFQLDRQNFAVQMMQIIPCVILLLIIFPLLRKANWPSLVDKYIIAMSTACMTVFLMAFTILRLRHLSGNVYVWSYVLITLCAVILICAVGLRSLIKKRKEIDEQSKQIDELVKWAHKYKEVVPSVERSLKELQAKYNRTSKDEFAAEVSIVIHEITQLKSAMSNESQREYLSLMQFSSTGICLLDSQLIDEQNRAYDLGIDFKCVVMAPPSLLIRGGLLTQFQLQQIIGDIYRNAVNAVGGLEQEAPKEILLVMGNTESGYQIKMCDTGVRFPEEVLSNLGQRGVSATGSGHGIADIFDAIISSAASFKITQPAEKGSVYQKKIEILFDGLGNIQVK